MLRVFRGRATDWAADHRQRVRRADGGQAWRRVSTADGLAHPRGAGGAGRMSDEVEAIFTRARLPLRADELQRLQRNYPIVQGWLVELRLADARNTEPAVVFEAQQVRRARPAN